MGLKKRAQAAASHDTVKCNPESQHFESFARSGLPVAPRGLGNNPISSSYGHQPTQPTYGRTLASQGHGFNAPPPLGYATQAPPPLGFTDFMQRQAAQYGPKTHFH